MTQYVLLGFGIGALAATLAILVFSRLERKEDEFELPNDLLAQIGEILGEVVKRVARLGKTLTAEQVQRIADWLYARFLPVRQLFTKDEWRGLLAMALLWLTDGPPATASAASEQVEWCEFEAFLKQL